MYRVGDKVRVKSLEGIKATLNMDRIKIGTGMMFPEEMERWCGTIKTIDRLVENSNTRFIDRVRFSGIEKWSWHFEWLEPIKLDNREVRQHG
jgi:hypothetical protein